MQISKTQLRQIIDGLFAAVEKVEGSHPLLVAATEVIKRFADGAGVDAIAAELAKLGITVTD